jgi:hypothetical protein
MTRRLTALIACAVLVLAAGGCGKKKAPGIPRSDASELVQLLKTARASAGDPQRCETLLGTISDLQTKVASLPAKVDRDVRESLANGVNNLSVSAQTQCEQTQTTPTTPTVPTVPQTTPTIPPPTQTIPPTTPTFPTTPTTPPPTTPGGGGGGGGTGTGTGGGGSGGGGGTSGGGGAGGGGASAGGGQGSGSGTGGGTGA